MKKISHYLVAGLFMGSIAVAPTQPTNFIPENISHIQAKIGTKTYTLEVARTMPEKAKGLSGRQQMASNHGMIFVFKHKARSAFTMNGMNFPLDFIWLNHDQVVELTENVARPTRGTNIESLMPITPDHDFDLAIELNAGEIKACGIKINDKITFARTTN